MRVSPDRVNDIFPRYYSELPESELEKIALGVGATAAHTLSMAECLDAMIHDAYLNNRAVYIGDEGKMTYEQISEVVLPTCSSDEEDAVA